MSQLGSEPVPAEPSRSTQPTLDPGPLAAWRASSRHRLPNFVSDLIDEFRSDMMIQIPIIEGAVVAGDIGMCESIAHRLRSSCTAIGAFRLAEYLEQMELLANRGAVAFLGSQFARIKAEYAQLDLALEQERY